MEEADLFFVSSVLLFFSTLGMKLVSVSLNRVLPPPLI